MFTGPKHGPFRSQQRSTHRKNKTNKYRGQSPLHRPKRSVRKHSTQSSNHVNQTSSFHPILRFGLISSASSSCKSLSSQLSELPPYPARTNAIRFMSTTSVTVVPPSIQEAPGQASVSSTIPTSQLRLTLFTPTTVIADRLPIRYARFQDYGDKTINIYAKHNNATFQVGPSKLFIVENGCKSSFASLGQAGSSDPDLLHGDDRVGHIEGETSLGDQNPFGADTVPTPIKSTLEGFKHHLLYISGGVAVKRKGDLIISALQVINPNHIDPAKVAALLDNCEAKSHQVMSVWEGLRTLGESGSGELHLGNSTIKTVQGEALGANAQAANLFHLRTTVDNETSPKAPHETSSSSSPTQTDHLYYSPAHPALEFSLYNTGAYVTSIANDVATSLDSTLYSLDQLLQKSARENAEFERAFNNTKHKDQVVETGQENHKH